MQRIMYFFLCCALIIPLSLAADRESSDKVIRLATTTSVENSGLLKYLLPIFQEQHPYKINLTVVGSGKALQMGRAGSVDAVLVHSPQAEKKFIDDGYGVNHQTVMRNDFILIGPVDDPDNISSASSIIEAFQSIARHQSGFVSRADDSGTNKKELFLWKQANFDPYGASWYIESGAGMTASLKIAQKNNAYILIDRATFLVNNSDASKLIVEDIVNLSNPYSIIAMNPNRYSETNIAAANKLINWLVSSAGQNAIAAYTYQGQQLYRPVRLGKK